MKETPRLNGLRLDFNQSQNLSSPIICRELGIHLQFIPVTLVLVETFISEPNNSRGTLPKEQMGTLGK